MSWVDEDDKFWQEMTLVKLHEHLDWGKGVDVLAKNKEGCTPLHLLAWHNESPEVIFAMKEAWYKQLQAKRPMGKFNEFVNGRDELRSTPLHWAALVNENPRVMVELVRMGADVNARCADDDTPLHKAARAGSSERVLYLVALGADINAQDTQGSRPKDRMCIFLNDKAKKALGDLERPDADSPLNLKYRDEDYKF